MLIKARFVGTSDSNCTNGNSYTVLSLYKEGTNLFAVIIDDNGDFHLRGAMNNPAVWTVDAVSTVNCVQIYP